MVDGKICLTRNNLLSLSMSSASDSLPDVNLIKNEYATTIENIKNFVKGGLESEFYHSIWENRCAEFLAKVGPNSGSWFMELKFPPNNLQELLLDDLVLQPVPGL
ncbi:hypothetical protein GmHk_20G058980 [Glycine max]|nr:hypothetical protein GmHk_20G058980 [Glycine max]